MTFRIRWFLHSRWLLQPKADTSRQVHGTWKVSTAPCGGQHGDPLAGERRAWRSATSCLRPRRTACSGAHSSAYKDRSWASRLVSEPGVHIVPVMPAQDMFCPPRHLVAHVLPGPGMSCCHVFGHCAQNQQANRGALVGLEKPMGNQGAGRVAICTEVPIPSTELH